MKLTIPLKTFHEMNLKELKSYFIHVYPSLERNNNTRRKYHTRNRKTIRKQYI